jgi:hypothetical protein
MDKMQKKVMEIKPVEFPLDGWAMKVRDEILKLTRSKDEHEKVWGIDRVLNLCDPELRLKVYKQMERVWSAQNDRDVERLEKAVKGMCLAYQALSNWATDNEIEQLKDLKVKHLQWKMMDGSVMLITETIAEALQLQQIRKDVKNESIWTMQEMEVILKEQIVQDVINLKAFDPTANVVSFSGQDDWFKWLDENCTDPETLKCGDGSKLFDIESLKALKAR